MKKMTGDGFCPFDLAGYNLIYDLCPGRGIDDLCPDMGIYDWRLMTLTRRELGLLGLIIYFTFIGGTFYSQLNFFLRVANWVVVTLILGFWLVNKLRRGQGLPPTYLDGAIGLYLAANLFSAILGLSPRFSLEGFWFTLIHTLAFYLLVDLMRRGWTAKLAWAFFMASAVVCLVGLTEFIAWYAGTPLFGSFNQGWVDIGGWQQPIPPVIYRLSITLNGSTPLAAYLALLIPPAIGLIISLSPPDQNRQALWLWLVLAFIGQILTFSRAGILALIISLGLMAVGWYRITGQTVLSLRFWRRLNPLYRGLGLLVAVLIVGAALFWFQRSFTGRQGSTDVRLVLWTTALTIFQNHWLTGAGPGNFGRALLYLNQADLPRLQIASAHNVYLNTAAELGLPGLLAGGYLLLRLVWAWRRRWQQIPETDRPARFRLLAGGAALAGLAAQTLVDTYSATPIVLVILALVAYIVSDLGLESPQAPGIPGEINENLHPLDVRGGKIFWRRHAAYGGLILLIIYVAAFVWITWADFYAQRSFQAENSGNLSEAVHWAAQAEALDPYLALRPFRLALLKARQSAQTHEPNLIQTAVDHYRMGLTQEPILGLNSANLAGLLWQQGHQAEAIDLLRRTITAEKDPLYLVNLGYFYEQEADWPEAAAVYGQALALAPALAGSGFWQATPERVRRWPDFVEAAVAQKSQADKAEQTRLRVNLALAREEFDTVELLVGPAAATSNPDLRFALAEVYLSRARPDQAAVWLGPPETAQDYLLWGQVKLQSGDLSAAETLLKTAVFLGENRAYYYLGQLAEQQGDLKAAESAYQRGFSPHYISENIEVTIYGRTGGNDLAPALLRLGGSPAQAAPWLALARLYEKQQRLDEARRIYQFLLFEDPFLTETQKRLEWLEP